MKYGRADARRCFARIVRQRGLKVVARRGTITWVDRSARFACMRMGRFTLRRIDANGSWQKVRG